MRDVELERSSDAGYGRQQVSRRKREVIYNKKRGRLASASSFYRIKMFNHKQTIIKEPGRQAPQNQRAYLNHDSFLSDTSENDTYLREHLLNFPVPGSTGVNRSEVSPSGDIRPNWASSERYRPSQTERSGSKRFSKTNKSHSSHTKRLYIVKEVPMSSKNLQSLNISLSGLKKVISE